MRLVAPQLSKILSASLRFFSRSKFVSKMRRSVALLALFAARSAALTVDKSPLEPPADILGEHLELQQSWTVSDVGPLRDLRLLRVPGAVFVDFQQENGENGENDGSGSGIDALVGGSAGSYSAVVALSSSFDGSNSASQEVPSDEEPDNGERVVARIVVSGSSAELLEAVEVFAHEDAGVALTISTSGKHKGGYLLTQILVSDYRALEGLHVESTSSSPVAVVVGQGVMPAGFGLKPITVKATSSGDASLFLDDSEGVGVSALDVSATFSAAVQVVARGPLSVATAVDLASFGSGDIAVVADSVSSKRVVTTVGGSGSLFVQTTANSSGIETERISTRVAGSGSVTLSKSGHCKHQDVVLLGSGDVEAGSVLCDRTDVMLIGSGNVVVQTSGELHATMFASGRVSYVGQRPSSIVERGFFFGHPKVERASDKDEDSYPTYQVHSKPSHREAGLVDGGSLIQGGSVAVASTLSAFSTREGSEGLMTGLVVVAICGAVVASTLAVGMVAHLVWRRRQRRHRYTRLV